MIERVVQETPKRLVSQSFVITLAPPREIYQYLFQSSNRPTDQQAGKEGFSFLRFLLAKKGDRLTFFGGKINPDEDIFEAIQRETEKRGGVTPIGIGNPAKMPGKVKKALFNLGKYGYNGSHAMLNAIYVLPRSDYLIGDGIENISSVSLKGLRDLINGENIDGLCLEQHLRLPLTKSEESEKKIFQSDSQSDEERFSIDDNKLQEIFNIFNGSLKWFERINNYLKKRFEKIKEENLNMTFDDFKKVYRKELLRFMRNGIISTLKNRSSSLTKEQRQKLAQLLREEEEQEIILEESEEALKVKEGLNRGFLGTDILYFLPQIIEGLLEGDDLNFLLSETTEATQAFFQYFSNFLREKNQQIEKIRNATTLEERNRLISEFDFSLLERLQQNFGISRKEIDLTFAYFHNFWGEIENTLKNADPNLAQGLVQNYRLLNEVSNASLGKLVLLMFWVIGFDEKNIFQRQLMFEAGRQLVLIMKGLLSVRYFSERTNPVSVDKISSAIGSFFGEPMKREEITYLTRDGKNRTIIADVREGQAGPVIVDQKPPKSWFSYSRKAFKEMPKEIKDYLSYSIVYLGGDKDSFIRDLINGGFKRKLEIFLQSQFPTSRIKIIEKTTFGLREFVTGTKKQEGKRTGSQAKRIVAMKYGVRIDDQVAELLIYPYLSTVRSGCDDNGWWMGWLEKRKDDDDYVVRRMLAGEMGIPSFYDLLFPVQIYPALYLEKLKATYHL